MPKEKITKTTSKSKTSVQPISNAANMKLILIFLIIGVFIGGFITLFYSQQKNLKNSALDLIQEEQLRKRPLEQKVQSLMREQGIGVPIVAEVRDVSDVENLPRYQFAKNGDKVLLFDNLFVIYDETTDQIVSAIPRMILGDQVVAEDTSKPTSGSEVDTKDEVPVEDVVTLAPEEIDVEVRNGGAIRGFAGTNSNEIKSEFNFSTSATNASTTYEETIIVQLGGKEFDSASAKLKEKYAVTKVVTELPEGEKDTDADIVVIVVK